MKFIYFVHNYIHYYKMKYNFKNKYAYNYYKYILSL